MIIVANDDTSDIFAIKKENLDRLDSIIGMVLGAGVFLCNAYRLDKRLSQNEMGETWRASNLRASQNVVIYLPPPEIRKEESAFEPVRKQAKRVEALDHPRIVPVLDNFVDPEHGFFTVRKLVKGKPLDTCRKLTPPQAVKIVDDIAHVLDYAHGADIIHGDLCSQNITIGQNDEVYVDNFTLMPISADKTSDVYALALIAYELLAGQTYSPETIDTPPPIPNVPSAVDAVIRKGMAKRPDDRYDSCGAFAKALAASFLEPPKIKPVPVKRVPSRRKILLVALTWMLALAFFVGAFACFVYFDEVKSAVLEVVQKLKSWIQ